jgi:L-cystine uptake protein TcyP (sodium:dicarboxylate symporter family)
LNLRQGSIFAIVVFDEVIPIARSTRKTKERKNDFAVARPNVAAFIQLLVGFALQLAPAAFVAFIKNAEGSEFARLAEPIYFRCVLLDF